MRTEGDCRPNSFLTDRLMAATKEKAEVQIPSDFLAFLREIDEMIRRGFGQVVEESDDGIQIPEYNTCGGLWDKDKGVFGFIHYLDFPPGDRRWEVRLTAEKIAEIAEEKVKKLTGWQCLHEECDNFYTEEDGYCRLCDHPQGREVAIASDMEFRKSVDEFTVKYGEELDALSKERVITIQSLANDPELLKDPMALMRAGMKIHEEFDEKVRKLTEFYSDL